MSREVVDAYPLTPLQQGMLFEVLTKTDINLFVGSATFNFRGPLEQARFNAAWRAAIQLFPALRTQFIWDGVEEPLQVVLDDAELDIEIIDCSNVSLEERRNHTAQLRLAYRSERIAIDQCPLMFLKLIKWSDNEYTLIWQVHHLVMDAWSASIVFKVVLELYEDIAKLSALQEKQSLTYGEYVQHLNSGSMDEVQSFWAKYLEKVDKSELNIPAKMDARADATIAGTNQSKDALSTSDITDSIKAVYDINERVWDKQKCLSVKEYCLTNSVTLAGFIHAAWAILVAAYSGTKSPYFGSVASGRYSGIQGIDGAVGLFINTLPFYTHLDSETSLVQWIGSIQNQLQINQEYGQIGLQDIKQHLALGPESSVFDTVVSIEPELMVDEIASIESKLSVTNIQFAVDSDVPLSMIFDPNGDFKVELSFDPQIVSESLVEQMQSDLLLVVDKILSGSVATSAELLSSLQQRYAAGTQSVGFNSVVSDVSFAEYSTVASWLNHTTDSNADCIAVQSTNAAISYNRLATIVSNVASKLRLLLAEDNASSDSKDKFHHHSGGTVSTTLVGICISSVWKQPVSFFGVLEAGLAYVPFDSDASDERLKSLITKSQCQYVITDSEMANRIGKLNIEGLGVVSVNIDDFLHGDNVADSRKAVERYHSIANGVSQDQPAYVMYTSGSTGEPKGVMVSHANLIYSTAARIAYYGVQQTRFMLLSPTVFDSSVVGIYWSLLGGGSLYAPERDEIKDVQLIAELIQQHQIDTILCLPTYYRLLLDGVGAEQLVSLKRVILAGESCNEATVERHFKSLPDVELYNEYGPTECTVWSSVAKLKRAQSPVSIGDAIPGTAINIVDEDGHPVPTGTLGEIVVTGPGVASGYRNDAVETSKRFVSSLPAFKSNLSFKCYRTGDLGSFSQDGQLFFHGRIDRQIKIRGHRIEPAEIENIALSLPGVGQCVAIGVHGTQADSGADDSSKNIHRSVHDVQFSQISVFIAPAASSGDSENSNADSHQPVTLCEQVLHEIENKLPAYMQPSQVIAIESFPKTATEKLDTVAMQSCEILAKASKSNEHTAASNGTESELSAAAQAILGQLESVVIEVLQVSSIMAEETFYELGGDSISAIMFVSRARERGLNCQINQIVAQKSFATIAMELAEIEAENEDTSSSVSQFGATELTPIQHWFFSLNNPNPAHWSIAYRVAFDNEIDSADLIDSVNKVLKSFPSLASCFTTDSTGWHCEIPETSPDPVQFKTLGVDARSEQQVDTVLKQMAESWQLDRGWKLGFIGLENQAGCINEIYVIAHHLVIDHLSVSQLIRSIAADVGYLENSESAAATESLSFRQYSSLVNEMDVSDLEGIAGRAGWPLAANEANGESRLSFTEELSHRHLATLNEHDTKELLAAADAANVNLLEVLVALLSCLWQRYEGEQSTTELDLYCEASGRDLSISDHDVTDVIGWLSNIYPFDKSAIVSTDVPTALKSVKNSLRQNRQANNQYLNWYFRQHTACPSEGSKNTTCLVNYMGNSGLVLNADGYTIDVCEKLFLRDENAKRAFDIELNAFVSNGQLHLYWHVVENLNGVFIENLSQDLMGEMRSLLNHLRESDGQPVYTPSDFSAASLSQDTLDSILKDIE